VIRLAGEGIGVEDVPLDEGSCPTRNSCVELGGCEVLGRLFHSESFSPALEGVSW
jgi:hypothetical protein